MIKDSPADRLAYRNFKSRLTRAQNAKDWRTVIEVANQFDAYYADVSPPDDWQRWNRAREDAQFQIRYEACSRGDVRAGMRAFRS